jgi:hypothetical protein
MADETINHPIGLDRFIDFDSLIIKNSSEKFERFFWGCRLLLDLL